DDATWLEQIPLIFEDDAVVVGAPSVNAGINLLRANYFDVIVLDLNFDGDERTGSHIFNQIKATANGANILVISGETDAKRLIDVFNAGASKFLSKPSSTQEIRQTVNSILEERSRRSRIQSLIDNDKGSLVGSSRAITLVKEQIKKLIDAQAKDILILGESGTGKEIVTKYIVTQSGAKSFCPIHCGAIAETLADSELFGHVKGSFTGAHTDRVGAFEAALGGFVFLDEIGDMPLSQQVKLLRVLQERAVRRVGATVEKSVQFRMIAATNRNLSLMVENGTFREDLYYRISKEVITLPPLRERKEDIPELVDYFIRFYHSGKNIEFTQDAILLLQKHSWPGNGRELAAVVDRIVSRSGSVIRASDVALALPEVSYRPPGNRFRKKHLLLEREKFKQALLAANYDRDKAAAKLGISRATYFRRAKELGLVTERRKSLDNIGAEG
ncbi:MAG: sigma-54-dependent Fis family transcriptional regulator, partial [Acidobacteria bacterium]|nr:sigma-54-dependent Fis family transcriptional regulator [Acidobacteriota bacterium]